MNYEQALHYIHSLNRFGINPGLERIEELCRAVGNPQDRLNSVHVAGTNGKGSTSTMIAGALTACGKRTGLFTSPYVSEFLERIQIDGKPCDKELFAQCVTELEPVVSQMAARNMQPTEFEVITAAAFMVFEKAECDICVLEVGLGGRLDSTNVIKNPLVSVIASISLDHTAILGETVEEIAKEKCGIIKPDGKTVCYPWQESKAFDVINDTCERMNSSLSIPNVRGIIAVENRIAGVEFTYNSTRYKLSMSGEYQVYNAITAIEACRVLGLDEASIKQGVEAARVPARMEVISSSPLVLLDGGHNEDGGKAVAESLKSMLGGKKIFAVIGMMADKNVESYLEKVAPLCSFVAATTVADNPRAMSANELEEKAKKYCGNTVSFNSAAEAIEHANRIIADYDCLLVCGSLYLAGEVRSRLKNIF
ncbi:MAG: bifunctional folylpolyglutamate synthase/dihydrofolate synthase [Clostridia bacterium]|nr:bifunctional folylpolyglutamate synthase/dihydrofolate synthase [Clostridia bacterium]